MSTPYPVEYFNERVLAAIEHWPVGVLADYSRLVELLMEFRICGCRTLARSVAVSSSFTPRPGGHRTGTVLVSRRQAGGRVARVREEDADDARAGPEDRPPPNEGGAWCLSASIARSRTNMTSSSRGP